MTIVQKKICLLGSFAVGKTSLVRRFVEGRFDDRYLSTLGVKISRKPLPRPGHTLNLLVWDLAGEDGAHKTPTSYLQGTAGALVVCDLTRPDTLETMASYAFRLRELNPDAALVFVGNKRDLTEEQMISEPELAAACGVLGGPYLLTSAKTGEQVELAFQQLADLLEAPS